MLHGGGGEWKGGSGGDGGEEGGGREKGERVLDERSKEWKLDS